MCKSEDLLTMKDVVRDYAELSEWFHFKEDDLYELEHNLLLLDQVGKGVVKLYNIKRLSTHGRQY